MKLTQSIVFGILAAFLASAAVPAVSEYAVAYAASFQCSKCGQTLDGDPHDPGLDQHCSKGGIHAWAPVASVSRQAETESSRQPAAAAQPVYRCSKCGTEIHGDHHAIDVDQHCPHGGIHSWVLISSVPAPAPAAAEPGQEQPAPMVNEETSQDADAREIRSAQNLTYQCSKCGRQVHGDHHAAGIDQQCPEGGIHSWVFIPSAPEAVVTENAQKSDAAKEPLYQCSKCGRRIHGDHHASDIDQHCSEGGIHAWVLID